MPVKFLESAEVFETKLFDSARSGMLWDHLGWFRLLDVRVLFASSGSRNNTPIRYFGTGGVKAISESAVRRPSGFRNGQVDKAGMEVLNGHYRVQRFKSATETFVPNPA
jgi:hypothetical protein